MGRGEWDLKRLVKDKRQLADKIKMLEGDLDAFGRFRKGLNNRIKAEAFNKILRALERIDETESLLSGYGSLRYAEDTQSEENSALKTMVTRLGSDVSNKTEFFYDWWMKGVDSRNAKRLAKGSGNLSYYLSYTRKLAKHSLSEPEERVLSTMSSTGISAWVKLYTTITNGFEYRLKLDGRVRSITREGIATIVRTSEKPETRRAAYDVLLSKYHENSKVLCEIYRNRVLNWKDTCIGLRKYGSPISARNMGNALDDKIVDALLRSCRSNAGIFREFFRIKAKETGVKKLRRYDIYAPIKARTKGRRYPYGYATKLVLDSWRALSPRLSSYAERVVRGNCIDYGTRKGKESGAFNARVTPSIPPYVQLSYNNDLQSLSTLAHELGHSIHYSAASGNSILTARAALPLAESASTFSEELVSDSIMAGLDRDSLRSMLFRKFEDYYGTIARQAFLTLFEIGAHKKIAEGAADAELNSVYYNNQKEQFGDSVDVSRNFDIEWTSIPHIYRMPFYCYSYSFGNLLSLALFQRYKKEGSSFAKDYEGILSAGGSKDPRLLLEEYGFDISSSKFWGSGFDYLKGQLGILKKS